MTENQNIEYKQSWRDEYLKWLCGFANAQGGKIFIGKGRNGRKKVKIGRFGEINGRRIFNPRQAYEFP